MALDDLVRKVSTGRKVAGYFVPILFDKYDALEEAKRLLSEDETLNYRGLGEQEVAEYLIQAKKDNNALYIMAQVADTADKITSIVGAVVETAGIALGLAPGFAANFGEELTEMAFKAPFLLYALWKPHTRKHVAGILAREAGTFAVPVAGDVYDALSNLYMDKAMETIRDVARDRIMKGHPVISGARSGYISNPASSSAY